MGAKVDAANKSTDITSQLNNVVPRPGETVVLKQHDFIVQNGDTITAAKSKTRSRTTQSDVELMSKKQIFCFKPITRLEQVDDEHSERLQDCKHRHQSSEDSAS